MASFKTLKRGLLLVCCTSCTAVLDTQAQNLSTGGFISVGYLESSHYNYLADSAEGTIDFVEVGLNASWTPASRTTVNGQAFLFELGPYGNYEPLIDYLFVDYSYSKEFGIRAGRIKRELGLYTHIQDIDISRTSIILPHGIYDPRFRAFSASLDGAAIYGSLDLPGNQRLSYNLYGGNVEVDPDGGLAGFSLTAISRVTLNNKIERLEADANLGAQIWYYPDIQGLRLGYGISHYRGIDIITRGTFPNFLPDPIYAGKDMLTRSSDLTYDLNQFSIEYFVGDWNFAAEYYSSVADLYIEQSLDGVPVRSLPTGIDFYVWYASVSRRIGKFELGVTYTKTPPDPLSFDEGSAAFQNDKQVSLRYDVTDNWTLKLEAHSIEGTKRLFNQYGQNPVLDQDSWTLCAAKSTFTF